MTDPFKIPLERLQFALDRVKPELITALGTEALHFIDDNFRLQGFQGSTFEQWPKRKRLDKKRPTRKILIDTGALRRSFRQEDYTDFSRVYSDIVYAGIHNDGGTISHPSRNIILNFDRTPQNARWRFGKAQTESQQRKIKAIRRATIGDHQAHMPRRRMIGDSPVLSRRCEKVIITKLIQTLNSVP